MTIRCSIIGCGPSTPGKGGAHSIAYAHAEAMRRVPGLELVAAASRTAENVADFCAEFTGCQGYRDYRAMLAEQRADLVAVCAFPPDREAMATAAIEAGAKAVMIEKPLALGLGAAHRILAAGEKAGCRLFVNHQRRYGKPFEWWRDAVANGELGALESIDIAQPGDNVMNFGCHLVDAALFALGKKRHPVRVIAAIDTTATGEFQGAKTENQLLAGIHFDDGVRLTLEAGRHGCSRVPVLRANGAAGFAELRVEPLPGEGCVFRKLVAGVPGVTSPETNEHFHHSEDGALYVERAYVDILRALTIGCETRIDAAEALRGLDIILGALESARLGRMLDFPIAQDEFPLMAIPPSPAS